MKKMGKLRSYRLYCNNRSPWRVQRAKPSKWSKSKYGISYNSYLIPKLYWTKAPYNMQVRGYPTNSFNQLWAHHTIYEPWWGPTVGWATRVSGWFLAWSAVIKSWRNWKRRVEIACFGLAYGSAFGTKLPLLRDF